MDTIEEKHKIRFSILVPVYNVESYLQECLESIISQTYSNYEVLLVDDGSKDQSGKICDDYATEYNNFRVIHQENRGLISARREAIKLAAGEFCIFCDSDDFLEKNALERIDTVIEEYSPDLVIYNAYKYDGVNKTLFFEHVFEQGILDCKKEIFDTLLLSYKINSLWLKACRTSIIDREMDYSDYYQCNYGEDLLQSVPILINAEKIFYLDEKLYNYRMKTGMTSIVNPKLYWSYKAVNLGIREKLAEVDMVDFEQKIGLHLLWNACAAIVRYKLVDRVDKNEFFKIARDSNFREAYGLIRGTKYMKLLTQRYQVIAHLLYYKQYYMTNFLLNFVRKK